MTVDLQKGFGKLKINKSKNVYVTSNLTSIAKIRIPKKINFQLSLMF